MAGSANLVATSPPRLGRFQFHRWAEGDLPGSPKWMANVQHLEGMGTQPHVDASNVDPRGGCRRSTPAAKTSIPPTPQPTWTSGGRLLPRLWACPSESETPPTRHTLDGINSMGLAANSTTLRLREPSTCPPSGTCVDVSAGERSIEDHHLHPAVKGTAFLRLVVCQRDLRGRHHVFRCDLHPRCVP